MNQKQRRIVGLAALLCAAMILFPPFNTVGFAGKIWGSAGYHFVGMAPDRAQVDIGSLAWQLLALGVATAGLMFAVQD